MVIVANKTGNTDGTALQFLQSVNSLVPIVLVSWADDFQFNDALFGVKDYVLVDFTEYGWNVDLKDTHVWGKNTFTCDDWSARYNNVNWIEFDTWIKNNPPRLTFKREILIKDVSDKLHPIDYPCVVEGYSKQSKEEFDGRVISVFQYWGRSNENRLRIHGEIWQHATKKGFSVCDNIYYLQHFLQHEQGEKWVTLNIPHYARIPADQLLIFNGMSKLSLSWKGAGFKCFRHNEAPVNSVMVTTKNKYAWCFPWDETNCILINEGNEISEIDLALLRTDLYEVYLNGLNNVDNYRLKNFIPYLENKINQSI